MAVSQNPTLFSRIVEYPVPLRGINLFDTFSNLRPDEAAQTKNMFVGNGLQKREGMVKFSATALSGGTSILGMHRYSYSTGEVILVASGSSIESGTGSAWTTLSSAFTSATSVNFSTWFNGSCYAANGSDTPLKITGSSVSSYSTAGIVKQFLPYQDRLLSIVGADLTWSGAYDDTTWGTVANIGVRPDSVLYGMCVHSEATNTNGLSSKVLLAGENGMYLFSGTDLRWPYTTGNYKIDKIFTVGCKAPKTMCWTPKGTIWLGMDNQVYMLPFSNTTYDVQNVIPIGTHITSNRIDAKGIESMPYGYHTNARAYYNDGFYKLAVPPYGGTGNTYQYWLDITRMTKDDHGHISPWYGPMIYPYPITAFCEGIGNQSHTLLGGATVTGTPDTAFAFQIDNDSVYSDNGNTIECIWETALNPLSDNVGFNKNINKVEFDLVKYDAVSTVDFKDIYGAIRSSVSLDLPSSSIYWGTNNWGSFYWSSPTVGRSMLPLSPTLQARMLSMLVKNTSASNLRIYGARVEAEEQSLSFPSV